MLWVLMWCDNNAVFFHICVIFKLIICWGIWAVWVDKSLVGGFWCMDPIGIDESDCVI